MSPRAPALLAAAALAACGCASSPRPASPEAEAEAAEQARRAERLKLMQQYWIDQTASLPEPSSAPGGSSSALDYPAGDYGGVRFAERRQADPSLEEPCR